MTTKDAVTFLNDGVTSPFYSKLIAGLAATKQAKAAPAQWISIIRALSSKGVSPREVKESGVIEWLQTQPEQKAILLKDLSKQISSMGFTIKEIALAKPKFTGYKHHGGEYHEVLYVLTSERDFLQDQLDAVDYQMNDLASDIDLLMEQPELVADLEVSRTAIMLQMKTAIDFKSHHFSDVIDGKNGKNLLGHMRYSVYPETGACLIQEVQSDWAQKLRRGDANVPKGPLIENTEGWARLMMARALQLAALDPRVKTVSWITMTMRNGWTQDLTRENLMAEQKAKFDSVLNIDLAAAMEIDKQSTDENSIGKCAPKDKDARVSALRKAVVVEMAARGIRRVTDNLNEFYLAMMPKIVDGLIRGTGEKTGMQTMRFNPEKPEVQVPTILMTEAVRSQMLAKQSVYSRANLLEHARAPDDPILIDLIKDAATMLGSAKHIRLYKHVYDESHKKVAGKFVNDLVMCSLSAVDIDEVMNHECFHFAQEHLLSSQESEIVREAFKPGARLSTEVLTILSKRGDFALEADCNHPDEVSAQGFALWRAGLLEIEERPVTGVFAGIVQSVKDVVDWVKVKVFQQELKTVESVFDAFASGELAQREIDATHNEHNHRSPLSPSFRY